MKPSETTTKVSVEPTFKESSSAAAKAPAEIPAKGDVKCETRTEKRFRSLCDWQAAILEAQTHFQIVLGSSTAKERRQLRVFQSQLPTTELVALLRVFFLTQVSYFTGLKNPRTWFRSQHPHSTFQMLDAAHRVFQDELQTLWNIWWKERNSWILIRYQPFVDDAELDGVDTTTAKNKATATGTVSNTNVLETKDSKNTAPTCCFVLLEMSCSMAEAPEVPWATPETLPPLCVVRS